MVATTGVVRISDAAELRPLTVDELPGMAAAGILDEDERLELLDGVMIGISSINPPHGYAVDELGGTLTRLLPDDVRVRIQGPIGLSAYSLPQPDITVMRALGDMYLSRHPEPADIFLLIEVVDGSLHFDRDVKLPLYARAGTPEFWIVDLVHRELLVYRRPEGERYAEATVHTAGDAVSPLAFPDVRIEVASLFPQQAS